MDGELVGDLILDFGSGSEVIVKGVSNRSRLRSWANTRLALKRLLDSGEANVFDLSLAGPERSISLLKILLGNISSSQPQTQNPKCLGCLAFSGVAYVGCA